MWTDKGRYGTGEEVTVHLRSNKDCYVTLLDLQTSGQLYVLFPNEFQSKDFIRADQIVSIPAPDAPFSINVTGPIGVEGLKAIATSRPIQMSSVPAGKGFIGADTYDAQSRLIEIIRSATTDLNANDWDIAEWTFEIIR